MRIDEENGLIIFDHIVSVSRELGSDKGITATVPAEKAVACNAKGTFKIRTLDDIDSSARDSGAKLTKILTS